MAATLELSIAANASLYRSSETTADAGFATSDRNRL
jgi:hypothetical protein